MIGDVQSKSDSQRLLARSRGGVHYSRFLSMPFNHVCECVCVCTRVLLESWSMKKGQRKNTVKSHSIVMLTLPLSQMLAFLLWLSEQLGAVFSPLLLCENESKLKYQYWLKTVLLEACQLRELNFRAEIGAAQLLRDEVRWICCVQKTEGSCNCTVVIQPLHIYG